MLCHNEMIIISLSRRPQIKVNVIILLLHEGSPFFIFVRMPRPNTVSKNLSVGAKNSRELRILFTTMTRY